MLDVIPVEVPVESFIAKLDGDPDAGIDNAHTFRATIKNGGTLDRAYLIPPPLDREVSEDKYPDNRPARAT
jgi:hypothetical protein